MTSKAVTKSAQVTKPNWVTIEVDFRAGLKTLRQIASEQGISHVSISKRATKEKWPRDLAAQIKCRAEAKVTKAAVTRKGNEPERVVTEEQVVEASAVLMANTILAERSDVARLRALANGLVTELEGQAKKAAAKPGETAGEVGIKVDPIAVRIENLRKLSETTKTLVALERTVLNITPDTPIDPSKRVAESIDNGFAGLKAKFDQKLGRAT